jgi:hypothetical protein
MNRKTFIDLATLTVFRLSAYVFHRLLVWHPQDWFSHFPYFSVSHSKAQIVSAQAARFQLLSHHPIAQPHQEASLQNNYAVRRPGVSLLLFENVKTTQLFGKNV